MGNLSLEAPVTQVLRVLDKGREKRRRLAPNRLAPTVGYSGQWPDDLLQVLMDAWDEPFALASNYARKHLIAVSLAASLGWLSTVTPDGTGFDRRWHLTGAGEVALRSFNKDS